MTETGDKSDPEDADDIDEVVSMYEDSGDSEDSEEEGAVESGQQGSEMTPPKIEPSGADLEEVTGRFYVKYAQDVSVTLHDVDTAQICTLIENPGFERHEIVEGTLKAQPPMGVSYKVEELDEHYSIPVERSPESLTTHVREIATEELSVGDAIAIEREGNGEIHILRVEPSQTPETAEELLDDEMTYKNAARYDDVSRVEIRTDEELGVVSIRYMP